MAQWISIEEAAVKYGFEAEYLWVLIEMREIIVDYQRPDVDFIDDRSIQDFVERNRLGATQMYIDKLERLCIDKSRLCSIYTSLLGKQDKEITIYKGAKVLYDVLQVAETMRPHAEVRKRTCIGANRLSCLLVQKILYENSEMKLNYQRRRGNRSG